MTFQETLDLTPATRFNVSNIKFGNTSNDTGANFALDDLEGGGARLIDGGEGDAFIVTFLFSEEQRTTLLEFSGVPGGDEFAAFITFGSSSFVDLFLNPNVAGFQNLIEHPDVVPPKIQQITVFLGSGGVGCGYRFCGYIQFQFSEFIHKDSAKEVSKAFIANDAFTTSTSNYSDATATIKNVSLAGATVTSIYKYNMNITLTEAQRTKIIAISGTPGGDNVSSVGNFLSGFVLDRSGLPLQYAAGLSILEFADTIIPNITRVVLDLNDGKVSIFVEEFVDATPGSNIEFSKISFANVSGDKAVPMDHTTSVRMENGDDAVLVVQLSERQRANVIAISGQRGGDNTAAILDVADGAFHDIAKNGVVNTSMVAEEIPDTTPPVLRRVEYNYMTGDYDVCMQRDNRFNANLRVDFSKFRIYDWKGGP